MCPYPLSQQLNFLELSMQKYLYKCLNIYTNNTVYLNWEIQMSNISEFKFLYVQSFYFILFFTIVAYLFFFLMLYLPKSPLVHSCISLLQVLLVVACGTLPQHGLRSGAMSASRIQTSETLGLRSGVRELNHSATGLPQSF